MLSEARDSSVKNEPQDFNEEEDMLSQSVEHENIKTDVGEDSEERNFGPSESVTISRSQAAMQQLQESFGSFLPGMGQSPGFLPHGATDMPRPPPYPLEGVQGKKWKFIGILSMHFSTPVCHFHLYFNFYITFLFPLSFSPFFPFSLLSFLFLSTFISPVSSSF